VPPSRMERWSRELRALAWASAALLIAGAPSQAGEAARIALDHGGGSGENWSVMVTLVPCFAASSRST